jgi:outer membrane scaffolding protein for murein synthesis (MipA/OmpV family)
VRKAAGWWWAGLDLSGTRSWFREPLDHSWQVGPQLILGRYYGHGSELSLSYQIAPLDYDTREQTDAAGTPIAGTHLQYLPQTVELAWQHGWDEPRRWRNTLRLTFEANRDNAAGYYDYLMYRVGEQLRYRAGGWEVSGFASVAYYDFPHQAVGLNDPDPRHRTSARLGLRAEWSLSRHWRVYAVYDYERSLSNLEVEQYDANTVSGGIEVAF